MCPRSPRTLLRHGYPSRGRKLVDAPASLDYSVAAMGQGYRAESSDKEA